MTRLADDFRSYGPHVLPYMGIGAAVGKLIEIVTAAVNGTTSWYPIVLSPAGVLTEFAGAALVLAMIALHRPYLCSFCPSTATAPAAAALARRQRLLRLCHPLPHGPHSAAWHALVLLTAYTTVILLGFTGMHALAMVTAAAIAVAWPLLGVMHRHWRRWCPVCTIRHPHSLSSVFAAQTGLIRPMFTEHATCAITLACTTADCGHRITYDRFDISRHRRAVHWMAHHLDTDHATHPDTSFTIGCHQHDSATTSTGN